MLAPFVDLGPFVATLASWPLHAFPRGITFGARGPTGSLTPAHQPLCRSQHSLGVSDLRVGAGGAAGRVYTCGLDQTLRIWSAAAGDPLACVLLGSPAQALVVAPLEDRAFVGLADGRIASVNLRAAHQGTSVPDASTSGDCRHMRGHTKAVTTVSLSMAGDVLVSGAGALRIVSALCRDAIIIRGRL